MIKITFPDGGVREYAEGTTPLQIAESISPRFAADVLAAKINGEEWDLARPVQGDASIELFKWDDPEGKHAFWHSSAHLLAEALQELYPGVKFGIGPASRTVSTTTSIRASTRLPTRTSPRLRRRCWNWLPRSSR